MNYPSLYVSTLNALNEHGFVVLEKDRLTSLFKGVMTSRSLMSGKKLHVHETSTRLNVFERKSFKGDKPLVVFDLDDTLLDYYPVLLEYSRSIQPNIPDNVDGYTLQDHCGIPWRDWLDGTVTYGAPSRGELFEGVVEGVSSLKESGWDVVIVTNRGYYDSAEEDVRKHIEILDVPFHVIDVSMPKGEFISKTFPNVTAFVDDNVHHLHSNIGIVPYIIGVQHAYNTEITKVPSVNNIKEAFSLLLSLDLYNIGD